MVIDVIVLNNMNEFLVLIINDNIINNNKDNNIIIY